MSELRIHRRAAFGLAGLFVMLVGVAWAKGTLPDSEPFVPTKAGSVTCQLVRAPEGRKPVRCVMLVDASPAAVNRTIRDYEHYRETFEVPTGYLIIDSVLREGSRVHLRGRVVTRIHTWPLDVRVDHNDTNGQFASTWDERQGGAVRRGGWHVSSAGDGALLAYELEVEEPFAPTFFVNDLLLSQLPAVVKRVGDRAREAPR